LVARPRTVREDGGRLDALFRRASADDAAALAELICVAGESPGAKGLYEVFFGKDR